MQLFPSGLMIINGAPYDAVPRMALAEARGGQEKDSVRIPTSDRECICPEEAKLVINALGILATGEDIWAEKSAKVLANIAKDRLYPLRDSAIDALVNLY